GAPPGGDQVDAAFVQDGIGRVAFVAAAGSRRLPLVDVDCAVGVAGAERVGGFEIETRAILAHQPSRVEAALPGRYPGGAPAVGDTDKELLPCRSPTARIARCADQLALASVRTCVIEEDLGVAAAFGLATGGRALGVGVVVAGQRRGGHEHCVQTIATDTGATLDGADAD